MGGQTTSQKEIVIVIGWFHPAYNAEGISRGIESQGHKVIRVAADLLPPNRSGHFDCHAMRQFSHRSMDEAKLIFYTYRQLSVARLVELYPEVTKVILIQNKLEWQTFGCPVPVYYYYTEYCEPTLPEGPIAGIIGGFVGSIEKLRNAHPYRVSTTYHKFIPYGMPMELMPTSTPVLKLREYFVGFKGLTYFNDHSPDPTVKYIYSMRNEYLEALGQWFKDKPIQCLIDSDHRSFEEYSAFMQKCQLAINIPGIEGKVNQRQFEALGFGCVLLQWYYPELSELGFYDKVNCITFDSIKELCIKLDWALAHPVELEQIRINGIQFYHDHDCSWEGRGKQIMDFIIKEKHENELLDFANATAVS